MTPPKLTKLELRVMETLWDQGPSSIRELQMRFPEHHRPAYTTVSTTVCRLAAKRAVRRQKKIGNAYIFEASISRNAAYRRLIEDLLALFDGGIQPVIGHLIASGRLTLDHVHQAERTLRELARPAPLRRSEGS